MSNIVRPPVSANNFGLKPNFMQMVQQVYQFDGFQDEGPYEHLKNFLQICDAFKTNNVYNNAVHLRLFPFLVRERAKHE